MPRRSQQGVIDDLRHQLKQWENASRTSGQIVSSGYGALDRLLPEGGFRRGGLVEYLEPLAGSGTGSLALAAARSAGQFGPLVVIDGQGSFYPPAAALAGIDLDRLILVEPRNRQDTAWAWNLALRCLGVGAVLGWIGSLNQRVRRQWQLAAEAGAGLGLLVCPATIGAQPCWAQVRLLVEPLCSAPARRIRVELLRATSISAQAVVELDLGMELDLDHETRDLHLDSPVAAQAAVRRSARA